MGLHVARVEIAAAYNDKVADLLKSFCDRNQRDGPLDTSCDYRHLQIMRAGDFSHAGNFPARRGEIGQRDFIAQRRCLSAGPYEFRIHDV